MCIMFSLPTIRGYQIHRVLVTSTTIIYPLVYGWIVILPPFSIASLTMWDKLIYQVKPFAFNDKRLPCSFYAVSHCLILLTPCRA